MDYYVVTVEHCFEDFESDLCVDALAGLGFESFESEDGVLRAYIPRPAYMQNRAGIESYLRSCAHVEDFRQELIPDQDWNAVWESQYEPVRFGDFCFVRAPFHAPVRDVKHDVVIEPKMSFGTAHHPTTALMIGFLQQEPPAGLKVLDMGCGTGILAILAAMQGAREVTAIDIDRWAYENAAENIRRNGYSIIGDAVAHSEAAPRSGTSSCLFRIELGDASLLAGRNFDLIIANINRNILINDMAAYAACLPAGGMLYLSGFYLSDMDMIERECNRHRLFYQRHLEKEQWAAMKFVKK